MQRNAEVLTGKGEEYGKAQNYFLLPKINPQRRHMVRMERRLLYFSLCMMEICNKIQTLLNMKKTARTPSACFFSFLSEKQIFEYCRGVAVTGPTIVIWLTKEIRLFCCNFSLSLVFCFHGYLRFREGSNVELAFPNV